MRISNRVLIIFVFISFIFSQSVIAAPGLTLYSSNDPDRSTDVVLLQNTDNTYILLSWGGASPQSADCVIKSKGVISKTNLTGHLVGVKTDIGSYNIENESANPFAAILTNSTLDITHVDVSDICGLNSNFVMKYFRITDKKPLEKSTKLFIELFEDAKVNDDLLPFLKGFAYSNYSSQDPSTLLVLNALYETHAKSLSSYKSSRKSEAAEIAIDFLKTTRIDEKNLNQASIEKYNDLGFFLEEDGKYGEAIPVLEKVIRLFPKRTVAYLNLADAYFGVDNTLEAKKYYEKYIDLMKKDGKAAKIQQRAKDRSK
jgi:tetratricopeptide (TPR) repeat protein